MPVRRTVDASRAALSRSPALLLASMAVVVFIVSVADRGAFEVTTWAPVTIFLLGLVTVGAFTLGGSVPRVIWVAVAGVLGFALWSYLSISWADSRADAWDGANRTLLYALVFSLFALWRLRAAAAATVLGGLAAGTGLLAAIELIRAGSSATPGNFFLDGQFSSPTSYANASVALWTMMLWPSLALASRREVPAWGRAVLGAGAVFLASAALLGQSRGWLFATPPTAIFFVLVMPQRVRLVLTMLLVVLAELAISRPLLDVYDAASTPHFGDAVASAARATVIAAAVVAAVIGVAAVVERSRPRPSRTTSRRAGRAVLACSIVAAVVGLVLFVSAHGSPFTAISNGWHTFKSQSHPQGGGSRFSQSLGSNRYDFWRVAWGRFTAHPLNGIGADNFQQDYLARARSGEQPRYPHSVELRTLSQTGLVGTALLLLGLGAAGWAVVLAIRRRRGLGVATAAAALTCFVSWLVHGSVDWFWEFAGLGAPAFAALGLAAGLVPRRPGVSRPIVRGAPVAAGVAVAAVIAVVSVGAPWLAQRDVNDAIASWGTSPSNAFDTLDRAASLNPVSPLPDLVAGSIALQLKRWRQAERFFRDAQARDGRSQFAEFELGLLAARAGRKDEAVARLSRAAALSRRDLIARDALQRVRAGRPVNIASVNHQLAQQTDNLGR